MTGQDAELNVARVPFRSLRPIFASASVRVLLDSARLAELDSMVEVWCSPASGLDLDRLYPPWYTDTEGRSVSFDAQDARPLSYAWLLERPDAIGPDHQARVASLTEEIRGPAAYQLIVPGYAVAPERVLVLDGNHRLLAGLLAGLPMELLFLSVLGPIDARVLPDLRHWADSDEAESQIHAGG